MYEWLSRLFMHLKQLRKRSLEKNSWSFFLSKQLRRFIITPVIWKRLNVYLFVTSVIFCRTAVQNLMTEKNRFFLWPVVHFQLFSRQANDGSPVQHGDIVGLRVPYHCNSCWMYRHSNTYFYSGGCSTNKFSCAIEGSSRGFQIYKMM